MPSVLFSRLLCIRDPNRFPVLPPEEADALRSQIHQQLQHPWFVPDDDCIIRYILTIGGIILLFYTDPAAFSVRRCLGGIRPADKCYAPIWYFIQKASAVIADPFDLQAFLVQGIFIFPF